MNHDVISIISAKRHRIKHYFPIPLHHSQPKKQQLTPHREMSPKPYKHKNFPVRKTEVTRAQNHINTLIKSGVRDPEVLRDTTSRILGTEHWRQKAGTDTETETERDESASGEEEGEEDKDGNLNMNLNVNVNVKEYGQLLGIGIAHVVIMGKVQKGKVVEVGKWGERRATLRVRKRRCED